MMVTRTLGSIASIAIIVIVICSKSTSGYLDATFTSTGMIFKNDTIFMNSTGLRIRKVNRTHVLTGTFELYNDTGNEFQMVSYIFKKAGNQYKKLAYKIGPYNFCQCFDEEKFFVEGMREKSNFPPKGTCPWPKQVYEIDDYIVKLEKFPTIATSGNYLVETQFSKDGVLLNGQQFFVTIDAV